jgi:hypothetical protein
MGRATMYMVHATPVIACNMYHWGPGVVGKQEKNTEVDSSMNVRIEMPKTPQVMPHATITMLGVTYE